MERRLDRMNGMAVKVKGREKTGSAGGRMTAEERKNEMEE